MNYERASASFAKGRRNSASKRARAAAAGGEEEEDTSGECKLGRTDDGGGRDGCQFAVHFSVIPSGR